MRARASIIGQLLVVFSVCAGLIGIAAIFGYTGVSRQDATAKRLTVQDYLLQHEAGLMRVEFDEAQVAVNGYALSGRRSDLLPLHGQETGYAGDVAALRAAAAKSMQGYVTEQREAGARLFAIARQVARLPLRVSCKPELLPSSARRHGYDDGAPGAHHGDRRVEHRRGRGAAPGVGAAYDAGLEGKLAAAPADPDDGGRGLDHVAAEDRRAELDVGVGREQALVTVHEDAGFRGHVAEQRQHERPVDEIAAVVGVAGGHVAALGDRQARARGHAAVPCGSGASVWTR